MVTATCRGCGSEFSYQRVGPGVRRFCSDRCPRYDHICKNCGKSFRSRDSRLICCSRRCHAQIAFRSLHDRPGRRPRPCEWCGKVFTPTRSDGHSNGDQRSCSRACTAALKAKRFSSPVWPCLCGKVILHRRGWTRCPECPEIIYRRPPTGVGEVREWTCKHCGTSFVKVKPNGREPSICESCRTAQRRLAQKKERRARRARLRGAECGDVDPLVVFERDGWLCGIRGIPTDPTAKVPNFFTPTIDHILPLARGGEHSYENVQCAHFICNSYEGAKDAKRKTAEAA